LFSEVRPKASLKECGISSESWPEDIYCWNSAYLLICWEHRSTNLYPPDRQTNLYPPDLLSLSHYVFFHTCTLTSLTRLTYIHLLLRHLRECESVRGFSLVRASLN
jgi:hypothetical protein